MKSNLTKLSLALLSAVFILGCQDQGSGPVGPEGLVPQFDKKGTGDCAPKVDNVHCHGDGGSAVATLMLAGGMTMDPLAGDVNANEFSVFFDGHDILMGFTPSVCVVTTGKDGRHEGPMTSDEIDYLKDQLSETVTSGSIFLKVDKDALTGRILVGYEGQRDDGHILDLHINVGSQSPVVWTPGVDVDVFEFRGPIKVAADGWDGLKGKKGRRAIACEGLSDNLVTATVTRPSA